MTVIALLLLCLALPTSVLCAWAGWMVDRHRAAADDDDLIPFEEYR